MGILNTLSFLLGHPLSQGRKLQTLRRYLVWQIGARLVPGPVACEFANGARLLVRPGMTGATGNVYVGLHEFEDMAFVLHFLRAGDLLEDIRHRMCLIDQAASSFLDRINAQAK